MEGDEAGEAGFLRTQIAELREKKDGLYAERADYANQEVHIRILLELVEQMAMRPKKKEEKAEKGDGSCYDYEEFFRLTRYEVPKGVLENGRISEHGTHEQLIARGGHYSRVNALQTGGKIQ